MAPVPRLPGGLVCDFSKAMDSGRLPAFLPVTALVVSWFYACTYGWPVGPPPRDGGADGPHPDAEVDGDVDDATEEATDGPPGDGNPRDVKADCTTLLEQADAAR